MTTEESALWDVYIQTGRTDIAIRDRIFENRYSWAMTIANALAIKWPRFRQDLRATAALAMLKAIPKCDGREGFGGYLRATIEGAIKLEIAKLTHGRRNTWEASRKKLAFPVVVSLNGAELAKAKTCPEADCPDSELLNLLPEEHRRVVSMRLRGMKYSEIAKETGTRTQAAWQRYTYALRYLRRVLEGGSRNWGKGRRVIQVETGAEFPSAKRAHKATGVDDTTIARACRSGGRAGGFHWRYVEAS